MTDQRPPISPTPPAAAAIGQQLVDQLKPMLDRAYDDIVALPGNPAERENDALSVTANVAAFVGMQLTARLMMGKQVDIAIAATVAVQDITERLDQHLAPFFERGLVS